VNGEPITPDMLRAWAGEFPAPARDPLALPDLTKVTIGDLDITSDLAGFKFRFPPAARFLIAGLDQVRMAAGPRSGKSKVLAFYAALTASPAASRPSRPRNHRPNRRPHRVRRLRGR
jgi:hypothetical protein